MKLVHDIWCHPGEDKLVKICNARQGRGFPRGFVTQLRRFKCATCAVSKRTRRYRVSARLKFKRASKKSAKKPATYTGPCTCSGCDRTFQTAASLASHLRDSTKCSKSGKFEHIGITAERQALVRCANPCTEIHHPLGRFTRLWTPTSAARVSITLDSRNQCGCAQRMRNTGKTFTSLPTSMTVSYAANQQA